MKDWYEQEFEVSFSRFYHQIGVNHQQFQQFCSLAEFPVKGMPIVPEFPQLLNG